MAAKPYKMTLYCLNTNCGNKMKYRVLNGNRLHYYEKDQSVTIKGEKIACEKCGSQKLTFDTLYKK